MKTLLIRIDGPLPAEVREIVRSGSTELKEVRADEERDASTLEADRIVIWNQGDIEVRSAHQPLEPSARLRWPDDEDKLRLFFQTGR